MSLSYQTVDVFTDTAFGGNPLAVVFGAEQLPTAALQRIAREFNYSETTFVLPPEDPANTARVRIFDPVQELPFAGHPNVGTATVLAWRGTVFDRPVGGAVRFEELAGLVAIDILGDGGRATGARLTAPQPFQRLGDVDETELAAGIGLRPADIRTDRHPPLVGSVGLPFVLVELADRSALERARPVAAALETAPSVAPTGAVHCYVRTGGDDTVDLRARMFAPGHGVVEDPATGSANAALMGLLGSLDGADGTLALRIAQGVEMGRPSLILGEADRTAGAVTAIRIGGGCVAMMSGTIDADMS